MRWDELFDDLAGQASAAEQAELRGWLDERSRDELGRVDLAERVRAAGSRPVAIDLVDGDHLHGTLLAVGDGWLALRHPPDDVVVTAAALVRVRFCPAGPAGTEPPPPAAATALDQPLQRRVGLRPVLRRMARQRGHVRLGMLGGGRAAGTVDGVGADHIELAEHPTDRPRRAGDVRAVSLVPLRGLLWLRCGTEPADGPA